MNKYFITYENKPKFVQITIKNELKYLLASMGDGNIPMDPDGNIFNMMCANVLQITDMLEEHLDAGMMFNNAAVSIIGGILADDPGRFIFDSKYTELSFFNTEKNDKYSDDNDDIQKFTSHISLNKENIDKCVSNFFDYVIDGRFTRKKRKNVVATIDKFVDIFNKQGHTGLSKMLIANAFDLISTGASAGMIDFLNDDEYIQIDENTKFHNRFINVIKRTNNDGLIFACTARPAEYHIDSNHLPNESINLLVDELCTYDVMSDNLDEFEYECLKFYTLKSAKLKEFVNKK